MRYSGIIYNDITAAPGLSVTFFTQGCPHHCEGCHNPQTHDFFGGEVADADAILREIFTNRLISGVTFSGGEPFCQAESLVPLAEAIKAKNKHLMIYTGYLLEELQSMKDDDVARLLELADVLVDGPFILAQRNLSLPYRGSENQRVIDMVKTRETGRIILYRSEYEDF